ncbi:MAG: HPr family phosphocarrier protein [bacterium]
MIKETVEVVNPSGLHARSAKELVDRADNYEATVTLKHDDVEASADSIMEVMMLAASPGTKIELHVNGPDEEAAADELINFFAEGFYENESNV